MSTIARRLANAVPRLILNSPLHPLMSRRYLVLTFLGRTSGRTFTLPVAYLEDGGRLLISTDSQWRHNVSHGERVSVRLRGRTICGTSTLVKDPAEALHALRSLVALPGYAKAAGVRRVDGQVPPSELERARDERAVLAIELETTR
jgi:hypothetical protein